MALKRNLRVLTTWGALDPGRPRAKGVDSPLRPRRLGAEDARGDRPRPCGDTRARAPDRVGGARTDGFVPRDARHHRLARRASWAPPRLQGKARRSGLSRFHVKQRRASSAPNSCPNRRSSSSSASSSGRLPAHPEAPLPGAPVEVVPLAAAHGRYAKTFRELLLSPQLRVAVGRVGCRTHRVAPLSQGRESPDGLSRALRPGVAVGEELPSLDGFRARSMRRPQCSPDGVLETLSSTILRLARSCASLGSRDLCSPAEQSRRTRTRPSQANLGWNSVRSARSRARRSSRQPRLRRR